MANSDSESAFGDLRAAWLEAFVSTVDNKKRTAAAEEMGVSEDTVTKNIKKLEEWLGGGPRRFLLWPNTYPPALTSEGESFLPEARKVLDLMREARKPVAVTVSPVRQGSTAHIRVPPPVDRVGEGAGAITEAGSERPVPRPMPSGGPDDEAPC